MSIVKWFGLDLIKAEDWYSLKKMARPFDFLKSNKNGYKQSNNSDKKSIENIRNNK